ncbi:MAG TPA: alpha/beta hydrolase [Ktedonobacteraceae bacterium]|nr:alpha/beta hydrolase [Ktedonobacteraceae bacterium]
METKHSYYAVRTHVITIGEQRLYYRVVGTGPPLVLIHGYGVSGQIWNRCIPYLAQTRQLYIIDLPGHGHSEFSGAWRLREIAPLLAQWLRILALPPVALLGHSMGGAIAAHLAAHAPERIAQLVLVNAACLPFADTLPVIIGRTAHSMVQRGAGNYSLTMLGDMLKPRLRLLWQAAQEMHSSDFRAELAWLTLPTLIIWGERDVLLPLTSGKALAKMVPHATFVTMPESGHRPPISQPVEFSKLVLDFLSEQHS